MKKFGSFGKQNNDDDTQLNADDMSISDNSLFSNIDDVDASDLDDIDLSDVDTSDLDIELDEDEEADSDTAMAEEIQDNNPINPADENSSEEDIFDDYDSKSSPVKGVLMTIAALAAVIAAAIFVARTDSGFIGGFKNNLARNIDNIERITGLDTVFEGSDEEEENVSRRLDSVSFGKETNIIPFEDASSAQFATLDRNVIAAKSNYLAIFNSDGETEWECTTPIVDPILSVSGRYILLAEKGGRKVCLYKDEHCLYSADAQNQIVSASVSLTGDAVVVTEKEFYKGAFEAFNKSGARIYSWSSGKDYIVAAAISPSTRNIAVALMNTDEKVQSHVQIFDINHTQSHVNVNFGETVVFGLEFSGSKLCAFTDCSICGLDKDGDLLWRHMYDKGQRFISYNTDAKGNKLTLISNNDKPELRVYTAGGKEKARFPIEEFADNLNINDRLFIFNTNRTITFGRLSSPNQCAASMEIKGLYVLDKDVCMVVYNNSIEFIRT